MGGGGAHAGSAWQAAFVAKPQISKTGGDWRYACGTSGIPSFPNIHPAIVPMLTATRKRTATAEGPKVSRLFKSPANRRRAFVFFVRFGSFRDGIGAIVARRERCKHRMFVRVAVDGTVGSQVVLSSFAPHARGFGGHNIFGLALCLKGLRSARIHLWCRGWGSNPHSV